MGRIVFTENIPFDMKVWQQREDFVEVYAGSDCIMARCADGTVLRKCRSRARVWDTASDSALRNEGLRGPDEGRIESWRHVRQISLSLQIPGLALGLTPEGRCVALLPPDRLGSEDRCSICETIENWRELAEVSATNDLFALTRDGRVLQWTFPERRGLWNESMKFYHYPCDVWRNITHLRGGIWDISGMTREGQAFYTERCSGSLPGRRTSGWESGRARDMLFGTSAETPPSLTPEEERKSRTFSGVLDLTPFGTSEPTLVVKRDHVLYWEPSSDRRPICQGVERVFACGYEAVALTTDRRLIPVLPLDNRWAELEGWRGIVSAAIGHVDWDPAAHFVVAVTEEG